MKINSTMQIDKERMKANESEKWEGIKKERDNEREQEGNTDDNIKQTDK